MADKASVSHGRVLVNYGRLCAVETDAGEIVSCKLRRRPERPVCGDHVSWHEDGYGGGVIDAVEDRRNVFRKADAQGQPQIVAANLDQVFAVIAPKPEPSAELVDRYLVAIHVLGLQPGIIANKQDLADAKDSAFTGIVDEFTELGYPVYPTSVKTGQGLEALRDAIGTGTAILVGQSGVGKSSLVNALIPNRDVRTGQLSSATGKGAHTTTTTTLYALPDGGELVDSPGVWEYGIWAMENDDIVKGFPEFQPLPDRCRFRNCRHVAEPDCAIREAVELGKINRRRWESYRRLMDDAT
ncbi:MAG: ribosome small subunit-dependent GTPase A [Gammaproteobacteria bacterium]|nr:MAG: ribosome small subunit-dependent GTPase A [Gammaproteobacteria bacterium]